MPSDVGEMVIARNYRRSKFDPLFGPDLHKVVKQQGAGVIIVRLSDGKLFNRHRDNLKVGSIRSVWYRYEQC